MERFEERMRRERLSSFRNMDVFSEEAKAFREKVLLLVEVGWTLDQAIRDVLKSERR